MSKTSTLSRPYRALLDTGSCSQDLLVRNVHYYGMCIIIPPPPPPAMSRLNPTFEGTTAERGIQPGQSSFSTKNNSFPMGRHYFLKKGSTDKFQDVQDVLDEFTDRLKRDRGPLNHLSSSLDHAIRHTRSQKAMRKAQKAFMKLAEKV